MDLNLKFILVSKLALIVVITLCVLSLLLVIKTFDDDLTLKVNINERQSIEVHKGK